MSIRKNGIVNTIYGKLRVIYVDYGIGVITYVGMTEDYQSFKFTINDMR